MKRLGILSLLALSLLAAVPAQAADPANTAPPANPANTEAALSVAAPLVLTIEDEASDLASLGAGEVIYTAPRCRHCPAYEEDCQDASWAGLPCSDPSLNCSCGFCGSIFGCLFN